MPGSFRQVSESRRALVSVYDKSGVVDLARGLADLGWELISSGGTARVIADAGIPVTDVAQHTGSPIMLGHRVVTLHPKVHGGILADRTDPEHQADMAEHDIDPIDLVVGNLYPFGSSVADFQHGAGRPEELIDIGGPAMVRAAAKGPIRIWVIGISSEFNLAAVDANDNCSNISTGIYTYRNTRGGDDCRHPISHECFGYKSGFRSTIYCRG